MCGVGNLETAKGAVVTLQPLKDNTIYEETGGALSNGQGSEIFVGKTGINDGFHLRRGLIAFDIASAIPAGSIVSDVTLSLYATRTSPGGGTLTFRLHLLELNWGEAGSAGGGAGSPAQVGDATWLYNFYDTTTWEDPGGDFRAIPSASTSVSTANQSYLWDAGTMVADVQGWVDNPNSNFGWIILGAEAVDQSAKAFASGEHFEVQKRPTLTITYTIPEPSIPAIFAIGTFITAARRRRMPE
jgi:hypothetical protein